MALRPPHPTAAAALLLALCGCVPALCATRRADSGTPVDVAAYPSLQAAIDAPELVLPGPVTNSDEILVNFSRTPYQGDAWGAQSVYTDIGYAQGPLQSGDVVALGTPLNQAGLTRPNEKVLEAIQMAWLDEYRNR